MKLKIVLVNFLLLFCSGFSQANENNQYIYFAPEKPVRTNMAPESPFCYRFAVSDVSKRLEEQLISLKNKYPNLIDYQISRSVDNSQSLFAKVQDSDGTIKEFFYTSSPSECNNMQLQRLKSTSTHENLSARSVFYKKKGNFEAVGDQLFYFEKVDFGDYSVFLEMKNAMEKEGVGFRLLVLVNNGGGSLDDALKIGELVRVSNVDTASAMMCASACVYIFAGGVNRISYVDTKFGLHRASGSGNLEDGQEIVAALYSYLSRMGVNPKLEIHSSMVNAEDIKWINQYEAKGFFLVTNIKDNYEIDIPYLNNILENFSSSSSVYLDDNAENAESESPLKCGVQENNNIECTVFVDSAQIDNVILNRGRCIAPDTANSEDIAALEKLMGEMKKIKSEQELYSLVDDEFVISMLQISLSFANKKGNRTPQEESNIRLIESAVRAFQDPRGKYHFGDEFQVVVPESCNLIEYTIDANGDSWTWTVE